MQSDNSNHAENGYAQEEDDKISSADALRLHVIMIYTSLALIMISMFLHYLMPDDQYFTMVGIAAIGFLFGKFTNNFGRKGSNER